jgi:hypothetical protein
VTYRRRIKQRLGLLVDGWPRFRQEGGEHVDDAGDLRFLECIGKDTLVMVTKLLVQHLHRAFQSHGNTGGETRHLGKKHLHRESGGMNRVAVVWMRREFEFEFEFEFERASSREFKSSRAHTDISNDRKYNRKEHHTRGYSAINLNRGVRFGNQRVERAHVLFFAWVELDTVCGVRNDLADNHQWPTKIR